MVFATTNMLPNCSASSTEFIGQNVDLPFCIHFYSFLRAYSPLPCLPAVQGTADRQAQVFICTSLLECYRTALWPADAWQIFLSSAV